MLKPEFEGNFIKIINIRASLEPVLEPLIPRNIDPQECRDTSIRTKPTVFNCAEEVYKVNEFSPIGIRERFESCVHPQVLEV